MKSFVLSPRSGFARSLFASGLLLVLASCGKQAGVDPAGSTASAPRADTSMKAVAAVEAVTPAAVVTNPLCEKTSFAEASVAAGRTFNKVDVIDEPDLDYLECVYLDSRDIYAGLTIRFVSTGKLVASSSKWQTAAAYFEEWSRNGKTVAGLGEGAAWTDMPAGLLLKKGDYALFFSASKSDLSDPATRARFEALAKTVVARLP